jgi:hypothetical protein
MQVSEIIQNEDVVVDLGMSVLGSVICTGKSDETAYIVLPKPQG